MAHRKDQQSGSRYKETAIPASAFLRLRVRALSSYLGFSPAVGAFLMA